MTEEHTLLLGEIKGKLDSLANTVGGMDGKIDKIDNRLKKVEHRAATYGTVGGGLAGVGLALLAEKLETIDGVVMAHAHETRQAVRRSYVMERLPLEAAAVKHGVSYQTARNWKRADKEAGDDWDRARAASRMAAGGLGDLTAQVLEDFAQLFQSTMADIKTGEYDALDKAEALSRLSDAYTKTVKAAGGADTRIAKLAVALEVLEKFAQFIRSHHPQHASALLAVIEPFGAELAHAYG